MQTAFYLYALGIILPPVAVIAGLVMLAIPRKAEPASASHIARAA